MTITAAPEVWRPAPGFEGFYEVSDLGHVRSVARVRTLRNGRSRAYSSVVLRAHRDEQDAGYFRVTLIDAHRRRSTQRVHVLVATAFHGPSEPGQMVRHLDGDSAHNGAANVAWGTRLENAADDRRHGVGRRFHPSCRRGHPWPADSRPGDRRCMVCKREGDRGRVRA